MMTILETNNSLYLGSGMFRTGHESVSEYSTVYF